MCYVNKAGPVLSAHYTSLLFNTYFVALNQFLGLFPKCYNLLII